ncbi:hypothetical protein [Pseudoalteromonas spongiae]|uniref:Uncharacterized protein n=1 Tax=Pseudoalteromonas spongiae TaxID=298657 RepID=A0ABU8ESI4_9GAMM
MSHNLLVWKWSTELDTPSKRRKYKMSDVASSFAESSTHPAIGISDLSAFLDKITDKFGNNELDRPFVIEQYENCLVFNYGSEVRFDIVPVIGQIASGCGFNATEF